MARKTTTRKKKQIKKMPWLFGRGGRDRVLICLAVNGAMHVRAIARAIGSDSHKTFTMVERLRAAGLVVKRFHEGGRKYVQLDRRLRIYRPLRRLLLAMDAHWPAERVERAVKRWHMPFDGKMSPTKLDHVFQSPVRSRILTYVASVGEASMKDIYGPLGVCCESAAYAINHWEKQGILRSRRVGRERHISLNPDFMFAVELKALLREIVRTGNELRGLRRAAHSKSKKKRRKRRGSRPGARSRA